MSGWWAWGMSALTVAYCVLTATCRLLQGDRRRHKGWGPGTISGAWRGRGLQPGRWAHGRELAGRREGCGGSGKDVGGRACLSIEGLGSHCPPHFLGLLHSQAAVTPVMAAVTSLHHVCGLLDLLQRNVVLFERKGSQCLHPLQTSCSLVPDRVTSTSGSSPCRVDASRPTARSSACPSLTLPCPRLAPRETSFTHAWPSFKFTHLREALCSRRSSQEPSANFVFMSLVI